MMLLLFWYRFGLAVGLASGGALMRQGLDPAEHLVQHWRISVFGNTLAILRGLYKEGERINVALRNVHFAFSVRGSFHCLTGSSSCMLPDPKMSVPNSQSYVLNAIR